MGRVFAGLTRGEGADLAVVSFDGEGRLDSLAVAVWPGLGLWAVRLAEVPVIVFGVTAGLDRTFAGGLPFSEDGWSWLLTEYGPAVAGRAAISGRLLVGLMGATDNPPGAAARVDSGRCLVVPVEEPDVVDEFDTVLAGEK